MAWTWEHRYLLWLTLGVGLFVGLAGYQLGLPGLHYDEAREAGVNAMEMLTGAPVEAFRGATIRIGTLDLPLMVQDYIGALNVYLALPFLQISGIGVPNLRALPLLLALAALLALERTVSTWIHLQRSRSGPAVPLSRAGVFAVLLLVAAPSFVFWNRQGIFVTNATLPLTFCALWQILVWIRSDRIRPLLLGAFCAGLSLYAKLISLWVLGPFALLVGGWWIRRRLAARGAPARTLDAERLPLPGLAPGRLLAALLAGSLPLVPLLIFNLQTGGTLGSVGDNWLESYYGVSNTAILPNLARRLGQLGQVLEGGHLWYLGGVHANPLAPWLGGVALGVGFLAVRPARIFLLPLLLLALAVGASVFTVSDLFITHYALVHPLAVAVIAIALAEARWRWGKGVGRTWRDEHNGGPRGWLSLSRRAPRARLWPARLLPPLLLGIWLLMDLSATLAYHGSLARSGGLADHSDASYHLAYHLRYNGLGAPIALDWGMDAPVRFLSQGAVRPIEIFGYARLDQPDDGFATRLGAFLHDPRNVYLLHAPGFTVFQGRREAFFQQARILGRRPQLATTFAQRDGTPLYEVWRVP